MSESGHRIGGAPGRANAHRTTPTREESDGRESGIERGSERDRSGVLPWSDEESRNVRGLRRAITAHLREETVDDEVAPMMAGLLKRLEGLHGAKLAPTDLQPPTPADPVSPPDPSERMACVSRVCGRLEGRAEQVADPSERRAIAEMVDVLKQHLKLKNEVLIRSR